MPTKLPRELASGDRLVARYGQHTHVLVADRFAWDGDYLHITFTDGTQVSITNLTLPVEVA